ncbi:MULTISPECIES: inositol monophosphatase [unclassified Paenibacillus]|uniref:inositol monophosphatase family protein n=1 Tax=unclassified Paenibacillus TaxID=185978 RepID=UPI001C1290F0|nr:MULTISPECIES: inositol monophosphatase [unclassified Paenibacillus]MBU5445320.1 inositol monophosphatase [Paenibacillus sp. MSJ-34]CAH0118544.1 Fructose-1, 6-bisphosphatase/inositol-1-monophosphatase [Paenibacillus sp. CECT 9249]
MKLDEDLLSHAKKIAIEAALAAARIAREKFGTALRMEEKGEYGDIVTEVDHLAEAEILRRIREYYPDHQISSEETGWTGAEGDWLWLVDPLDGTNNYAIGLPVFGVSITLLYRKEPVLGVIVDSAMERLYVAEAGKGAESGGMRFAVRPTARADLRKMTVGWIQGHQVQKEAGALRLRTVLDASCKRVLRLWAPTMLWCMLARGDIDGIVLYNSEGDDLYAGVLLAKEAGVAVMDFSGEPFAGMNSEPYIIACRPQHAETFLKLVRDGMPDLEPDVRVPNRMMEEG